MLETKSPISSSIFERSMFYMAYQIYIFSHCFLFEIFLQENKFI